METNGNYWASFSASRITRRRALRGAAMAGATASVLAVLGCGDNGEEATNSSSLVHKPIDSSDRATRGGILPRVGTTGGFDVTRSAAENAKAGNVYSRLVKYATKKFPEKPSADVEPDAAASWEVSPDGLTVTYKLRPGLKFDPRPPTNGKVMTSADVKYSWDLFEFKSTGRATLANSANPDAPIASMSAPDASTATFKLAFPYAGLNAGLAYVFNVLLVPTEAETGYNINSDMRGTGPWRLKEHLPDSRTTYERNPDWYNSSKVHLDGLTYYIIPEYANQIAQFRTGSLSTMTVTQEDILPTKNDLPQLLMTAATEFDTNPYWLRFGYLPNSPFRDERVRKAASMTLDRDLFVETFANVDRFEAAGLNVPMAWNSCFGAGNSFWLDPKDAKVFGEHAKWFRFDQAEAKKLMTAAGQTSPYQTQFTLSGAPGTANHKAAEVYTGMWNESGLFNFKINVVDLNSVFRPQYHYNYNKHEGVILGGGGPAVPDPDNNLQVNFKSGQERTGHLDADGKPDAYLDQLIAKQRGETDAKKREAILHELQRYHASHMYTLFKPGSALGFNLAQPWFGNWAAFAGPNGGIEMSEWGIHYWIDKSKQS